MRILDLFKVCLTRRTPIYANIFLTRRCNFRCKKCRVIQRKSEELNLDNWKKIIDNMYKLGTRIVALEGGEPTLRSDLCDIIKYIHRKKMIVSLVSNASLLTIEKIIELKNAGLNSLGFSIDSLNPIKDYQMRRGSKTIYTVELLNKIKSTDELKDFFVSVSIVVNKKNIDEIIDMVKYFSGKSINVNIQPIMSAKPNENFWWFRSYVPDLFFKENDYSKIEDVFKSLIKMKTEGYKLPHKQYLYDAMKYLKGEYKMNCEAGNLFYTVNSDGRIMPCQDLPPLDFNLLNINNAKDFWNKVKKEIKRKVIEFKCNCFAECYYNIPYFVKHPLIYIKERVI